MLGRLSLRGFGIYESRVPFVKLASAHLRSRAKARARSRPSHHRRLHRPPLPLPRREKNAWERRKRKKGKGRRRENDSERGTKEEPFWKILVEKERKRRERVRIPENDEVRMFPYFSLRLLSPGRGFHAWKSFLLPIYARLASCRCHDSAGLPMRMRLFNCQRRRPSPAVVVECSRSCLPSFEGLIYAAFPLWVSKDNMMMQ